MIRRFLAGLLAIALGGNGLAMVLGGASRPDVLVRLIGAEPAEEGLQRLLGLTYLICGIILARRAASGDSSMEPLSAVAGFFGVYATARLYERFSHDLTLGAWLNGYPGFLVPALVGLIIAWPSAARPSV